MALRLPKTGTAQIVAFLAILAINWTVSPQFFDIRLQDGRLFGSLVDVFNRGAPVALLSLGMVLVIATRGIDLSVGAVMAISGAIAASLADSHALPVVLGAALGAGLLCGLWNGILVAVLGIQPIVATLILMVAGRGIAQLITEGRIVTFTSPELAWFGGGSVFGVPAAVVITFGMLIADAHPGARHRARADDRGHRRQRQGERARRRRHQGDDHRGLCLVRPVRRARRHHRRGRHPRRRRQQCRAAGSELDAILAVVIGGTSLFGGRFSLVLAVLGALIIQAMNTGILLSGFPPEFNLVVKAVVVMVVLLMQSPRFSGPSALLLGGRK